MTSDITPPGDLLTTAPDKARRAMIIGPGNYNVTFIDLDQKMKTIKLFMSEEHVGVFESSGFRVIAGFENKGGQGVPKVICLGSSQMATLELDTAPKPAAAPARSF
jgi:hypothetical protein